MQVTEAKFNRRFKTGEYEHEDYTLTAVLEKGDKPVEVLASMKADVVAAFSGEAAAPAAAESPAAGKGKKGKAAKKEPEPEEEDEDEIPADAEEEEEESEEEESEEEESEEEEEEETKPAKGKKSFKKKPQAYSRSSEQHKEIFSKMLLAVAPDWKKSDDSKARAKSASQKMEGKDFLDEQGEVLPEFKAEVKKLMASKKK